MADEAHKERRRFFRIMDRVSLTYRVVQSTDIEQELARSKQQFRKLAELRNASHAIDTRLEVISMKLMEDNPLVNEALTLLQRKLSLQERMLGVDHYDESVFTEAREVNLSASGVAFHAETPLQNGTFLKMELVTYPEHQYIPVFARVVQCHKHGDGAADGYKVAVEFKGLSDEDEERIVNHIFRVQAQEIKLSRHPGTGA